MPGNPTFKESEHPRGKGGEFINKNATVRPVAGHAKDPLPAQDEADLQDEIRTHVKENGRLDHEGLTMVLDDIEAEQAAIDMKDPKIDEQLAGCERISVAHALELADRHTGTTRDRIRINLLANPLTHKAPQVKNRMMEIIDRTRDGKRKAEYMGSYCLNPLTTPGEQTTMCLRAKEYPGIVCRGVVDSRNANDQSLRMAVISCRDEDVKAAALRNPHVGEDTVRAVAGTTIDRYTLNAAMQHDACPSDAVDTVIKRGEQYRKNRDDHNAHDMFNIASHAKRMTAEQAEQLIRNDPDNRDVARGVWLHAPKEAMPTIRRIERQYPDLAQTPVEPRHKHHGIFDKH